ncbi:MAG TPA: hypothetical protein ENK18_05970 [Deltaproteobacteria bacterium]|nr:hypothetical protein [Deltaproteobacteria bacterium]
MNGVVHLGQLVLAEILKLQSRTSARAGWLALALLGALPPAFLAMMGDATVTAGGGPVQFDLSAANGVRWALVVRNFYIAQTFLLLLGAQSLAGEYQARTLREDLLRPVPRWAVLGAKWGALSAWSGVAVALQWVVAVVVSVLLLGSEGDATWKAVFLGHLAAWLCDTSFAAVVLLASAATRTATGTIAAVFLFVALDKFLGWILWIGKGIRDSLPLDVSEQVPAVVDWLLVASPYLPSRAWGIWSEVSLSEPPVLQSWLSLVGITLLAALATERIFARTDVP